MYCSRFFVVKPFFQTPTRAMGFQRRSRALKAHQDATNCHPARPKLATQKLKRPITQIPNPMRYQDRRYSGGNFRGGGPKSSHANRRAELLMEDDETGPEKTASQFGTDVIVTDPLKALDQMQQCFAEKNSEFRWVALLLAHMPPALATQLAASLPQNLHFDLVISQGDDLLATLPQTITVASLMCQGRQQGPPRTPIDPRLFAAARHSTRPDSAAQNRAFPVLLRSRNGHCCGSGDA